MDFHILGSLEVVDAHRVVTIGGNKQQALLAVLLLHPNETLSADRLIEELWGQHPPATAAKTLQVHVSRLRKTLADGNGADGVLGRTLATGSTDGTIRLWDMKTQEPVGAPPRASG